MEVAVEDLPYLESFLRQAAGDCPYGNRESSFTELVQGMAGKAVSGADISMAGTRDSLLETGLSLDDEGRQELENFLRDSLSYMLLHRINRPETGAWRITGKSKESMNSYCTTRITACELIEEALNLKTPRIFDCWRDTDGSMVRRLNREETVLAEKKQDMLKEAFKDWIFRDPERRQEICGTYNQLFNSVRLREFDGSRLSFPGMNPAITLRPHQKDAVARQLFGGNTLLAHCVGAGKTYEMAAACMESIRLGLSRKGLFVVPNHLTGQWASDFRYLYPGAKVLAATKKDFAPAARKTFCARIATGDYDAVIIGHSQFEKIPLSNERQARYLSERIDELRDAIEAAERNDWRGENRFNIKQMEKSMQGLRTKLERLQAKKEKDSVVTFEELGVDHLYVDESHLFKNLALYTKMSRVSGISATGSAKAEDMYIKCRYLDELTGGRGITFATGTPVSNSVAEFFTIQRYLQAGLMTETGFRHFDAWASTFGDTVTAMELAPEGSGYRSKTRFARFINVPELMTMFRQSADIRTAEMLQLDVPEAEYETVTLDASPMQKEILQGLAERAENIRAGQVDASVDNMLAITTDGKKMALDIRVFNPLLPEDSGGKTEACVQRAFSIWEETKGARSTQLIFCDLSTPQKR